jgi:anti-sigma factor RsiW
MTELSDELLVAYVDGQLDRPQAATLARLLGEDDELVRRVRRLQQTQARLMDSFAAMQRDVDCSGFDELLALADGRGHGGSGAYIPGGKWVLMAALLVLGGAGGFGASHYFAAPAQGERTPKNTARIMPTPPASPATAAVAVSPAPPAQEAQSAVATVPTGVTGATGSAAPTPVSWTDELAGVHVQLTRDAASGPEGPANRDLAPFQLASLAGKPLPVPDFSKQGLALARSQMLSFKGVRLMQLSYSSAGRTESAAALYIMAGASAAGSEPLAFGSAGDVRTAGWSMDGVRYVIAGKLPPDALRVLAAVAQSQISKRA